MGPADGMLRVWMGMMMKLLSPRICLAVRRFAHDASGAFVIFALYMIVFVLLAVGVGIDMMNTEIVRTRMQNTVDRAVLAAADLEQNLTPEDVVRDYFARSGVPAGAVNVQSSASDTERVVTADITANVGSLFINMVGVNSLPAPAVGTAREAITDVEVSLILDNSGSMGWNDDYRLDLLKPAASDFVDEVLREEYDGSVMVSLVPFSTQVNAGPELASALNLTSEHTDSQCVEFEGNNFDDTAVSPTEVLQRVGHFDPFTENMPLKDRGLVCQRGESRHILPWSNDADELKAQIDDMYAWGNTSIDVAAKWGAALLDPAFRPVLSDLIEEDEVAPVLSGQPFAYTRDNTLKVLVVMSDGQNTNQYKLKDGFRAGSSPVFRDPTTDILSVFDEDAGLYFVFNDTDIESLPGGTTAAEPLGGASAVNLDWRDLFSEMSVRALSTYVLAPALGGDWDTYYDEMVTYIAPNAKNTRLKDICQAARDQGVVVYTIGMDTYGEGDAVLNDCAGTSVNFYDVESEEIDEAFSSIARQISYLRLTQ